jgi:hypothetical protein
MTQSVALAFRHLHPHGLGVLLDFVGTHREAIIARARTRVASRTGSGEVELEHGIPVFLARIGDALGHATSCELDSEGIGKSFGEHRAEPFRIGLTIAQVIRDYADVCEAITDTAVEKDVVISTEDRRTLAVCLDAAIAHAITEYSVERASGRC